MSSTPCCGDFPATTYVRVEVKGSLDIPLQLDMLADLGDQMMEQEIIQEAVRIAVSERLGYFDGVRVSMSSRSGPESAREDSAQTTRLREAPRQSHEEITTSSDNCDTRNSRRRRYCEATVNLDQLGRCVEMIQKGYESLLMHAQLLHQLLNADTVKSATEPAPGPTSNSTPQTDLDVHSNAVEILAAARQLVTEMLADHRPDVVAQAAALHACSAPAPQPSNEKETPVDEHVETTAVSEANPRDAWSSNYCERDGGETFGRVNHRGAEDRQRSPVEDREDEEALRARYLELGYTPL